MVSDLQIKTKKKHMQIIQQHSGFSNLLFYSNFMFIFFTFKQSLQQWILTLYKSIIQLIDLLWYLIGFVSKIVVPVLPFHVVFEWLLTFQETLLLESIQLPNYELYFEYVPKHQLNSCVDTVSNHSLQRKIHPY